MQGFLPPCFLQLLAFRSLSALCRPSAAPSLNPALLLSWPLLSLNPFTDSVLLSDRMENVAYYRTAQHSSWYFGWSVPPASRLASSRGWDLSLQVLCSLSAISSPILNAGSSLSSLCNSQHCLCIFSLCRLSVLSAISDLSPLWLLSTCCLFFYLLNEWETLGPALMLMFRAVCSSSQQARL